MKRSVKIYTASLSILVLILFGCQEIRKKLLPAFNVNIPEISLNIPPIKFVSDNELPVGTLRAHINMDSTIRANTAGTFGADAVHSVKVKKLIIKLANADINNNLANFESARMRIYSDNDTSAVDIVVVKFPTSYSDSVSINPPASPEISNYLKGSQLTYNLYWKNRKPTNTFLKLSVRVSLSVQ